MEIPIYCMACKEEIFRADTKTLRTPLVGSMFRVKKDMEWDIISQYDIGKDLICPLCTWTFHEDEKVAVMVGDNLVTGWPKEVILKAMNYELGDMKLSGGKLGGGMADMIERPKPRRKIKRKKKSKRKAKKKASSSLAKKVKSNDQEYLDKKKAEEGKATATNPPIESKDKPKEEPEEYVNPPLNRGDWNETENTNADCEMSGKAPPGMVATEPKK